MLDAAEAELGAIEAAPLRAAEVPGSSEGEAPVVVRQEEEEEEEEEEEAAAAAAAEGEEEEESGPTPPLPTYREVLIPTSWKPGVRLATTLDNGVRLLIDPPTHVEPGTALIFEVSSFESAGLAED